MNTNKSIVSSFKWMYQYVRPYKKWFALNIAAIFLVVAFNIIKIYLVRHLIDTAISRQFNSIGGLLTAILATAGIGAIASYVSRYSSGRYGAFAARDIKESLVKHIGKLPMTKLEGSHTSKALSCFNTDAESVGSFISEQFPSTVSLVLMFISAMAFMLTVSWKLVVASLIFIPLCTFIVNRMSEKVGRYSRERLDNLEKANGIILDAVNGISVVKAYNLQDRLQGKYQHALNKAAQAEISSNRLSTVMLAFMIAIFNLPYVICIVAGGYLAIRGEILVGSLVAFIQLLEYIIDPMLMYKDIISNLRDTGSSIERLEDMLCLPVERQDGEAPLEMSKPEAAIEFKDVCFSYEQEGVVLDNVSFSIARGETVALVGESGSGKSTIINLICGFIAANKGNVRVLGMDADKWNLKQLRENIALVTQDSYMFPATIRENISYGVSCAMDEAIAGAAKAAYADEFIKDLEAGYETYIGEKGNKLSGGQRQRVAIARAMIKNAPILILDEPTAALDNKAESIVQKALEQISLDKTVLVVAHRLSTIINADRILVLEDGRIVEQGRHQELIEQNGKYKQLYLKQLSAAEESLGKEA